MRRYIVEYDNNSVAWLVDVLDASRLCLAHGMLLAVDVIAPTCWPTPETWKPKEDP